MNNLNNKIPKKKPSKAKGANVCPWLVDMPLDHMK